MTQISRGVDAKFDTEQVLLKVDDAVRFGFCDDRLVVEHLGRGLRRELSPSFMPLLAQFATWTPVSHAFSDPHQDLELIFALVRDWVACGFFMVRGREVPGGRRPGDRWKVWGGALPYHLESRIAADETYRSRDESAALLVEKARDHPPPPSFKDYPAHAFYPLPNPEPQDEDHGFLEVLLERRTWRSFARAAVTTQRLSTLLFFTWGCTGAWRKRLGDVPLLMKTSPSGGARHSVEVYPILLNISDLPNGIYHYSVRHHGLEMLSQQDPREWLVSGCGDQEWVNNCSAVFVMTAAVERMMWKYAEPRAYRVLLFDVGHLSQTFALVATSLGLGSFAMGALRDEVFEQKLGLDCLEEPILFVTGAGVPATGF